MPVCLLLGRLDVVEAGVGPHQDKVRLWGVYQSVRVTRLTSRTGQGIHKGAKIK